ncbi:cytochrome P450 90D2-like [Camellia sinensis]|uniref:cytochrome P450 90D2-like n=1 Tax=Camellia sinensis TaxID=4442 RepID=UPI001036C067|nr:cytochrome P450 90D2-like [Camellia sinensis]
MNKILSIDLFSMLKSVFGFSVLKLIVNDQIAFQVLVKALISIDPGEEIEFLRKLFQEFIAGLMSLPINFPGSRLHKSLQAKKKMVELVNKIIKEKRNSGIPEVPKDVADVLIGNGSEKLTEDLISDNMIDLMIPGEDSVPVLITLAVKYLSDCPAALLQLTVCSLSLSLSLSLSTCVDFF